MGHFAKAERLAAFMINDPEHFKRTGQLLDADDSSSDGFVALRDNGTLHKANNRHNLLASDRSDDDVLANPPDWIAA